MDATTPVVPKLLNIIRTVFLKELRYLSRSGILLFGVAVPLGALFFAGNSELTANPSARLFALPMCAAYAFMALTRQMCNSFGNEDAGVQLYFLAPARMRTIILAKNLYQTALFSVEVLIASAVVIYEFGRPSVESVRVTLCWLLFALPVQLALANILSITKPYKMSLLRFSNEAGGSANGLIALLVQALVVGTGAAVYVGLTSLGESQWVPVVFVALAAVSLSIYLIVLCRVDPMAFARRDRIMATLVRLS